MILTHISHIVRIWDCSNYIWLLLHQKIKNWKNVLVKNASNIGNWNCCSRQKKISFFVCLRHSKNIKLKFYYRFHIKSKWQSISFTFALILRGKYQKLVFPMAIKINDISQRLWSCCIAVAALLLLCNALTSLILKTSRLLLMLLLLLMMTQTNCFWNRFK